MSLLQQLSTQALIGSERSSVKLPVTSGKLDELLTEISNTAETPETCILRAAGLLSICTLAGFEPLSSQGIISASPSTTKSTPQDKSLIEVLQHIFNEAPQRLRAEVLLKLAQRGYVIPPRILPTALHLGARYPELRPYLSPVIGERGFWLANLNPDWAYLLNPDDALNQQLWETGTREQRLEFLKSLRQQDPTQARELLAAGLGEFDARERAMLLEGLRIGLSAMDEPLLETLLRDRSKEVRQIAADLLASLPSSAYVQRIATQVQSFLTIERKLLRKTLTLEPPEQFAPAWKDDAIEESRAQSEPLGQRAWWFYQLARALPLNWWETATDLNPEELLKWAQNSDWSLALLRAWYQALVRERNPRWAKALLAYPSIKDFSFDAFELITFLSPAEQEEYWLVLLTAGPKKIARGDLLARIIIATGLEHPLVSTKLARQVFQSIKKDLGNDHTKWDYTLRNSLVEFACLIPPDCFAEAIQGWPIDQANTQFFADTIARLLVVIEQRKTLIEQLI